jgi:hypothetical protein
MVPNNNKQKTGESKIWLGDDGIMRLKVGKEIDTATVERIFNNYKEIAKNLLAKPRILVDIRLAPIVPSSLWRKRTVEVLKDGYKGPGFEKFAFWGGITTIAKVITKFVISATRLKDVKYFDTEEEALK